jgi:hypothetical protein
MTNTTLFSGKTYVCERNITILKRYRVLFNRAPVADGDSWNEYT